MRDLQTTSNSNLAAPTRSLPPRVVALARSVSMVEHPNQPVRHHLPKGWSISDQEREQAREALQNYEAALDPNGSFEGLSAYEARLGIVTKLIAGTATQNATETSIDARFDMFEMSLNDMPAWAVAKAVERWARGDVPAAIERNPVFAFTPAPQTIRRLAELETGYTRSAAKMCRKVVGAITFERAMDPKPIESRGPVPMLRRM